MCCHDWFLVCFSFAVREFVLSCLGQVNGVPKFNPRLNTWIKTIFPLNFHISTCPLEKRVWHCGALDYYDHTEDLCSYSPFPLPVPTVQTTSEFPRAAAFYSSLESHLLFPLLPPFYSLPGLPLSFANPSLFCAPLLGSSPSLLPDV